tara:strand:+ start:813 stop:1346 length:534 start_codon:yes stop_codon:yes gene_type:complete
MGVNFSGGGTQKYKSNIVKVTHFSDATRNISFSNTNSATPIQVNFTKEHSDTGILVFGFTPVSYQRSYHAGMFMYLSNVGSSGLHQQFEATNFMSPYDANHDHPYGQISLHFHWVNSAYSVCQTAGTKQIGIGWHSRNNSSQQPGDRWNPENRAARTRARTTQLTIMEIEGQEASVT